MKYIVPILLLIFLAGCATKQIPMDPSVYLLSTDSEPRWLLDQVSEELVKNKYTVESLDYNVGLLVMAPRRFVIPRGDKVSYGEQYFQIRQEGGSVKVRMSYMCDYPVGKVECYVGDNEADQKIKRLERLILAMINRKLFKKPGEDRAKTKDIEY